MTKDEQTLHENYMRRCFDLARKGRPHVRKNPLVGCCIVHNNRILAEGFHEYYGGPHAEINALNNVKAEDRGLLPEATMYVNLEPCNHDGKTPPCSPSIIDAGIRKVVYGLPEPNLIASGGAPFLRTNGCKTIGHVLEKEAGELNRAFLTRIKFNRPYITLKWAQTADGIIGHASERLYISNPMTNRRMHALRAKQNAILVGGGTISSDQPQLTTRLVPGKSPLRVVVAGRALPSNSTVFTDDNPTVLFTPKSANYKLTDSVHRVDYETERLDINEMLKILHDQFDVGYLLVEGGANMLYQFIEKDLWDSVWRISAPTIQKEGIKAPSFHAVPSEWASIRGDMIELFFNEHAESELR